MQDARSPTRSPWAWIPSLYLAEGLPYVMVMTVSVILYKRFGISNTDIALYTSWLYLPWVVKPLWSPVVDILGTRRRWIWVMQLVIGAALAGVALAIPAPGMFRWTLVFFWLMAFNSATHDIAADGFYMLATSDGDQAKFVGIRSTFYRLATIGAQGLLVVLAGTLETRTGDLHLAWAVALGIVAALMLLFGMWHRFVAAAARVGPAGRCAAKSAASCGRSSPPSARSSRSRGSRRCSDSCCCSASAKRSSSRWCRRSCSIRAIWAGSRSAPRRSDGFTAPSGFSRFRWAASSAAS